MIKEFNDMKKICERNGVKISENISYNPDKEYPIDVIYFDVIKYEENKKLFDEDVWNSKSLFFRKCTTDKEFILFRDFTKDYPEPINFDELNNANRKSTIAEILMECGIYLLSFSDCGSSPRFYNKYTTGDVVDEDVDYLYVFNNEVWLVLKGATKQVISVPLAETSESYSRIVEEIIAAANAARVVL